MIILIIEYNQLIRLVVAAPALTNWNVLLKAFRWEEHIILLFSV